ncbi:Putative Molybdopterin oxidoreductase subunit protein [Minicystis rosea]|nr:Putative Molybdopterin oxidoreductase subunit protein [Minicystis rosea]
MAAVFPPWSNTAFRVAIVVIALGGFSALAAPMIWVRTPWVRAQNEAPNQPVEFDHRHHARDDGIDCKYCHNTAHRAATAGMPSTDKCMGCHEQIWGQSPLMEMVRRSYFSGAPIPWNRVHQLPDFVYFNHAIHVNKGFGCSTCHGRIDQMAAVYQVASLSMGWCLDCHRQPERFIRPLDQITNMDWTAGDRQLEIGRRLVSALGIRSLTGCTTCHR